MQDKPHPSAKDEAMDIDSRTLRKAAEARAAELERNDEALDRETMHHELHVYQAELEIQNEHLRETQRILTETRNYFSEIFQHAPVGYILLDENAVITDVNRVGAQFLNQPIERLQGKPISAYLHEIGTELFRFLNRILHRSGRGTLEVQLTPSGGPRFWARLDGRLMPRDDEAAKRVLLTILDVTPQKEAEVLQKNQRDRLESLVRIRTNELEQANLELKAEIAEREVTEERLRQNEEHLRETLEKQTFLVNNTPLGVIEWDHDFRVTRWSRRAEEIFGWTAEEVMGRTPEELGIIYHEDHDQVWGVIGQLTAEGGSRTMNTNRNLRRDGSVIHCQWYESSRTDERTGRMTVLSLVHDVTDRVEAQRAVALSEQWHRALFESAPSGIAITTPEGRLIQCNKALEDITGYSEETLTRMPMTDLYADPADRRKLVDQVLKNGRVRDLELRMARSDQTVFPCLVNMDVLELNGRKRLLAIVQDITERNAARDRINHLNAVLRSIRSINQLIVRETNKEQLLTEACRHLTETRGFVQAWTVLTEDGRVTQWAGSNVDLEPEQLRCWTQDEFRPQCAALTLDQPGVHLFNAENRRCGRCPFIDPQENRTTMVVRMSQGDRVYGFLSVVLELAYPVDEEERALLEEVADDLAFALRGIELERQREENLWELRLMDSAIDSAMAPICFLDLHGRLTFVNSSFLKMWGYDSEEEVLGKPAADFMDLEYQWTEDAWIGDLSARRRDGSYFSVYLTANKVQTEDGQPICVMLSAVDTTDRRRAEEQLKQAHAFLKSLIDSVPDIIFHKDVEGRYQLVNRTMARFLGKAEEEILDRTDADILPPEEAERILAMDRQVMDGQISRIHEEVITTADDRSMVLETVKTPQLAPDGQVIGLFGVSRDITDRIAAENALREKEVARVAAVEASHMKDEFLAAMSHEIRTPLGGMTGFAQTLKRLSDRGRLSPDQFESIIENIVSSGRHLTNLVEDIMDITRIEAGHIEVNPEEVNLGQVLDSLASSFAEQARQKQMSVDFTSNPDLPSVRADGKRLNQILYNLIGNAIKYTEEGSVRVWAEIDSDRPDMVRVSVVDTGPGIDEKDQSKIFDRFTRLSGADKVTGAGLGLAITSRLVQLMGGRIWVESRLGRGAAFRFTLPVWAETAPART